MSAGSGTPRQASSISYTVTNVIETFPKSLQQSGSDMVFNTAHPEAITITSWPLTEAETINLLGQYFYLFDNVNGQLSYGGWNLVGTTLTFLHVGGFQNFTTNVASGTAYAIPDRDTKNFDQCSVKAVSAGATVNGAPLVAIGSIINVHRNGNSNYPVIIDCKTAGASEVYVSNMIFAN